jgi:YafQ family addiction module toxin component
MYSYEIRASLEKEFFKLAKKKPQQLATIGKKIKEISSCENVDHYKNLKSPLQHLKRVHIDNKTFVLVFSVNEKNKHIIFEEFNHHDKIYKS